MSDGPTQHPVKDIVLPLAVVIGLIGNAWWGGIGWGQVSSKLETVLTNLDAVKTRTASIETQLSELETWRKIKDREDAERDKDFRLFKMYTKGRIARLPYRPSDDGE